MLPYVVIILGGLYLLLHFSGVFDDIARFFNRPRPDNGQSGSPRHRIDNEIERRLKVFEDFLKSDEDEEPD